MRQTLANADKRAGQFRGSVTQTFHTLAPDEIMEREDFSSPLPAKTSAPAK